MNFQRLSYGFAVLAAVAPSHLAYAVDGAAAVVISTPEEVAAFFKATGKKVITYSGYTALGYEDEARVINEVTEELRKLDRTKVIINSGGTSDGIGLVYGPAKKLGFETSGIVSEEGVAYGMSPDVDHKFFIKGKSWGGFKPGTKELESVSEVIVRNSSELRYRGGGAIGADELEAAVRMGKKVKFTPTEMSHQKALAKAVKQNKPAPTNFMGESQLRWEQEVVAKRPFARVRQSALRFRESIKASSGTDTTEFTQLPLKEQKGIANALAKGGAEGTLSLTKTVRVVRVGVRVFFWVGAILMAYDGATGSIEAVKKGEPLADLLASVNPGFASEPIHVATAATVGFATGVFKGAMRPGEILQDHFAPIIFNGLVKHSPEGSWGYNAVRSEDQRIQQARRASTVLACQSAGHSNCDYYYTHEESSAASGAGQ